MLANVEAEAALIGALMQGGAEIIDLVAERLRPADFAEPIHERIYQAIIELHGAGKPVTPVLLKPRFVDDEGMKALGGVRYLARLTADGQGMLAPRELADQIADFAVRRRMRERFTAAAGACDDLSLSIDIVAAQGEMPPEATPGLTSRLATVATAFREANERLDDVAAGKIKPGLMLGSLPDWDDVTGGLVPGDLILVGARPSMGKTALTTSVAWRAAQAGYGVLFLSLEMPRLGLLQRMQADLLFQLGGTATMKDIKEGRVSAADRAKLRQIEQDLERWPFMILDPDKIHADQINMVIRQQARQFARRGAKLDLVIIDHLGFIEPPVGGGRTEEVTAISRAVKQAARSNEIPIILLSQLSRSVEQRDDKRPVLRDLRDSGALEQDADVVVFIYRDQYYLKDAEPDPADKGRQKWEEDMAAAKDKMEFYTSKNRQGALCRRTAWFFADRQAVRNSDFYQEGR